MEGAALMPINQTPLFTEHCTCGHRAIDHSLCWWLGDLVRLKDQHIIGPCGSCNDCRSFSYDGLPHHESKLISLRDYNNAPTVEEAEEIIKVEFPTVDMSRHLRVSNVKVHNRVLSNEEIAQRVADLVLDCLENNALAAAG